MSSQETKALVRRFIEEVWNNGRLELVDELVSADYLDHSMPLPGREGLKQWISGTSAAFDHQSIIEDQISEDDRSVLRITFKVTQKGEWRGIAPGGQQAQTVAYRTYRVAGGKIVEHWGFVDGNKLESELRAATN